MLKIVRVPREWAAVEARMQRFVARPGRYEVPHTGEYLGKVCRGEADEDLLDLYVRQRRTANIEFVQTQSIGNKRLLEEAGPDMIWSVRRAAEVT